MCSSITLEPFFDCVMGAPIHSLRFLHIKGIEVENETEKKVIRMSIPIDRELNDKFASIMPPGLKAEVIRCLVELVISTQRELGKDRYLIHHLINRDCKLVIND